MFYPPVLGEALPLLVKWLPVALLLVVAVKLLSKPSSKQGSGRARLVQSARRQACRAAL